MHAVAAQTLRHAGVPASVRETLDDRLRALAGSRDLLIRGGWESASLPDVVQRAVSPYAGSGRVAWDGPPVRLAANRVKMLNLALHELATNAAKYGALSVPEGNVEITWTPQGTGRGPRLVEIAWRERDARPSRRPSAGASVRGSWNAGWRRRSM